MAAPSTQAAGKCRKCTAWQLHQVRSNQQGACSKAQSVVATLKGATGACSRHNASHPQWAQACTVLGSFSR